MRGVGAFVSSCGLLVARYLFWACFALLHSFCFGAVLKVSVRSSGELIFFVDFAKILDL